MRSVLKHLVVFDHLVSSGAGSLHFRPRFTGLWKIRREIESFRHVSRWLRRFAPRKYRMHICGMRVMRNLFIESVERMPTEHVHLAVQSGVVAL